MLHSFIDAVLNYFGTIGYADIFFLMAIESSIIPFPSEVIMIPAGVSSANGFINPFLAALFGGLGSLLGALVNYYIVGKWLGKPFLWKYGKYFLIKHEQYERTEKLFQQNANLYTFVGRLLPVIRQLISVPAGMFGMKLIPFILLTTLGASIWSAILVALGYFFGNDVLALVKMYSSEFTYIAIPLIAFYLWYKIFRKK